MTKKVLSKENHAEYAEIGDTKRQVNCLCYKMY